MDNKTLEEKRFRYSCLINCARRKYEWSAEELREEAEKYLDEYREQGMDEPDAWINAAARAMRETIRYKQAQWRRDAGRFMD